ncbi:MAG TPA: hypothetical protein DIC31_00515, partial [Rhizobiales bacterium]|nr:hypothetical protein [Hyphomicrobiales bacterium]
AMHTRCVLMLAGWLAIVSLPAWAGTDWTKVAEAALHNHLLRAQQATFYMHILGHGDPVTLATTLHDALGVSNTPIASAYPQSSGPAPPPAIDLDTAMIDQTLGAKGKVVGGVYQIG